jgi:hypothetical protein
MTVRLRWPLLVVTIGGVLAGCAPAPSPTPVQTATPTTTAVSSQTAAPSRTAAPTPSPSVAALPQGSEPVTLDPARFAGVAIDNPFWPMSPGSRWAYRETDADGTTRTVDVIVTNETRKILGIEATVVHDYASEDGATVEDTFDWYAQDADGNLWYLGEDTKEFENGKVTSTEGSWEAGVDGAQPGIILPAHPVAGMTYRQEWLTGQAEDTAAVMHLDEHVKVKAGDYHDVLTTREFSPLEPDVVEYKFYARGVGEVQAIDVSGGTSREELLSFVHP